MTSQDPERGPLLASDYPNHEHRFIHNHPIVSNTAITFRRQTKRYLTSKTGHYSVLLLVSLDVSSIFADFLIELLSCKGHIPAEDADQAQSVLGIVSLVFSCLFMLELIASIWAFGWQYFNSWFHCFDATVILAGFVVDVILKGYLEEIGSLVVILRLWRVFKIIEELSAGAEERMEPMQERLEDVEKENRELRQEIDELKKKQQMESTN